MKKNVFILSIFCFFLLGFFQSNLSYSQKASNSETAVIKTNIYCSHCKECETCGKLFQANMYKIKGLKMYELDPVKMTFTVYFNQKKTSLLNIKTAISKLGFEADEIKADEAAYQKLDACCKK